MQGPFNPLTIRNRVREYSNRPEPSERDEKFTKRRGAVIGTLTRALAPIGELDKETRETLTAHNRHLVLGWLFTPEEQPFGILHTEDLTPAQVNGLFRWIGAEKVPGEDGKERWVPRNGFQIEAGWILTRAQWCESQQVRAVANGKAVPLMELNVFYEDSIRMDPVFVPDFEPGGMAETAIGFLGGELMGEFREGDREAILAYRQVIGEALGDIVPDAPPLGDDPEAVKAAREKAAALRETERQLIGPLYGEKETPREAPEKAPKNARTTKTEETARPAIQGPGMGPPHRKPSSVGRPA